MAIPLEQLARQAQNGSILAFEKLIQQLQPLLMGYLRKRVSDAWVDDLTQEIFLRVYNALDQYDPERPFKPWVLTIASRLVIDMRRQESGRREVSLEPAEQTEQTVSAPWANLSQAEESRRLWAAARKHLAPLEFEALRTYYYKQNTLAETAAAMNITVTHAKVLLHRARKKLLQTPQLSQEAC